MGAPISKRMLRKIIFGIALTGLMVVGNACSRTSSSSRSTAVPAQPRQILHLTGSSTVAPLVSEMARRFEQTHSDVQIVIETGGSGRGVSDARAGTADIGMASRALNDDERDLLGFLIARDGICLLVNKCNPVRSLTNAQVVGIYTGVIKNWKEVGGLDAPIQVVSRTEGRSEVELFLHYFKLQKADIKAQAEAGDNSVGVQMVANNRDAIVYMSAGESERCAATARNIRSGNYPLSRPLTLVTKGFPSGSKEEFINYCLSWQVTDIVRAQQFVPYLD
jgi:phosphate transport system substrate-binding protein